jgi:glycyl-tRNA synthetase beta subunit
MVMVEEEAVRNARLALLRQVQSMFEAIADFSEVVAGGKAS